MPDGGIIKCDNDDVKDSKGYIDEDGKIVRTDLFGFEKIPPLYEGSVCSRCKHLPLCYGPCPSKVTSMIENFGDVRCQMINPDEKIERWIREFAKES